MDHEHFWEFGNSWDYPPPVGAAEGDYEVLVCEGCGEYRWQEHTHV